MSEFKIERKVQRQGKLGYSYTVVIPKAVANYLELDKDSVVEFSINDNKDVEYSIDSRGTNNDNIK